MPNKTITVLTAPARITRMEFFPAPDGTVQARVTGQTTLSDGTVLPATTYEVSLPVGNAIATSVQTLAAGGALTFWKTQEGL